MSDFLKGFVNVKNVDIPQKGNFVEMISKLGFVEIENYDIYKLFQRKGTTYMYIRVYPKHFQFHVLADSEHFKLYGLPYTAVDFTMGNSVFFNWLLNDENRRKDDK